MYSFKGDSASQQLSFEAGTLLWSRAGYGRNGWIYASRNPNSWTTNSSSQTKEGSGWCPATYLKPIRCTPAPTFVASSGYESTRVSAADSRDDYCRANGDGGFEGPIMGGGSKEERTTTYSSDGGGSPQQPSWLESPSRAPASPRTVVADAASSTTPGGAAGDGTALKGVGDAFRETGWKAWIAATNALEGTAAGGVANYKARQYSEAERRRPNSTAAVASVSSAVSGTGRAVGKVAKGGWRKVGSAFEGAANQTRSIAEEIRQERLARRKWREERPEVYVVEESNVHYGTMR